MIRQEHEIRAALDTHGYSTGLENPYKLGNVAAEAYAEGFLCALKWVLNE